MRNPNIKLFSAALDRKCGKRKFYITANPGHSSIYRLNKDSEWLTTKSQSLSVTPQAYTERELDVETRTIDCFCSSEIVDHIDILKLDTQGSESRILEGAQYLLSKRLINVILLEIIHSDIYESTTNYSAIEKYLLKNGYRLCTVGSGGSVFKNLNFQQDVIYVKSELLEDIFLSRKND